MLCWINRFFGVALALQLYLSQMIRPLGENPYYEMPADLFVMLSFMLATVQRIDRRLFFGINFSVGISLNRFFLCCA